MAVAEVFELDAGGDDLDARFTAFVDELRLRDGRDALARSGRYQNQLLAFDAQVLAGEIAGGAGDRQLEDLAGRGTTRTKRDATTGARRARAVHANPALAVDLASGQLTVAGLDAIAFAADQSDGAAATDTDLIERVKAALPDLARPLAKQWLDDRTTPDEHEKRYDRQRRLRNVSKYPTRNGLMAICAEGDREHIEELWSVLAAESKRLYQLDGGRDLPAHDHPRTRNQRLFDALHAAVTTGNPTSSDGKPAVSNRRVQVYVTLTLDQLVDGATKARLVGGGTIPRHLLDHYLTGDAKVAGVLFNGDGHILWHGRNKRWATQPQLSALIARDEGCTICAAHPDECDGHHLIPYNSPAQGHTNTDELAPACTDCHHHIHTNHLTLYCQPHPQHPGKLLWKLRPATPDELPP